MQLLLPMLCSRRSILTALLIAPAFSPARAQETDPELQAEPQEEVTVGVPEELEALHHQIYDRIYEKQIGCLSILVVQDGEVVWEQGFGWANPDEGRAASSDTIYPVASISKGLVGLAASLLVAEGRLDWDADVSDVLDSFAVSTGPWIEKELTVRDLAQMTASIPHGGITWLRQPPATASEGSLRAVQSFAVLDADPGGDFSYSNYTFGILEAVVQDVSGESLDQFLTQRIFGPLGMTSTRGLRDAGDPRLLRVHSGDHVFDVAPFLTPTGGQGFYSSVKDLGRLAALHLGADLPIEINIPASALVGARTPRAGVAPGPGGYWLGWGHVGDEGLRFEITNGQGFDATSCMVLCPERGTVAICLTDTQWNDRRGGDRLADVIAMRAMDAVVGGCTDAFEAGKQRYMSEERREREQRVPTNPIAMEGRWSGTLTLAGKSIPAEMEVVASGAATLTFGDITASSSRVQDVEGRVEGSFTCTGEMEFFGESSPLSSLSIRVSLLEPDHLGGSATLAAYSTERQTTGSGGALLELRK